MMMGLIDWMCDSSYTRHATLFDPADQQPEQAASKAAICVEAGTRLILVGGSTNTPESMVHSTVLAIKSAIPRDIPILLFPGGAHALSPAADGILFMSLLNSSDRRFIVGEQIKGAEWLHDNEVEMLPTAYLICSPGGKAGEVGKAMLLEHADEVLSHSLCASGFGMKIIYLEAGSGASSPVSPQMISAAKAECLMVGGGIRTPTDVRSAAEAGADWVVTGTLVEEMNDPDELRRIMSELISVLRIE